MNTLKVVSLSNIDLNLEDEWDLKDEGVCIDKWQNFIKAMPNVVDAKWVVHNDSRYSYTEITFESEAHMNWFIMRWL